ncbi:glycosyltransferase [Roseiflexus castenholzii]|uniref:Glycosyl transferase group 1 n=1 Tax=Roseiflexus castenholzii (strain DSM 13941 / HLO8) TaxID=383372 RepID=A7NJP8_ROSCS|nr:glycosyltransferase [Roseiflexus castenholzii]ABU57718.1 glycosyl transferase group 1 [Roseiflexus castenholzii DSM 13941]
MNILFISAYVPSAIRVRPYGFIRALARRGHHITLVCGANADDRPALSALREVCARIVTVHMGKAEMLWNALRALPGDLPLQAALSFGQRMLEAVRTEDRSNRYDIAHIEHMRASALGYALLRTPAVLDSVDSISLLFERALRGSPSLKSRMLALIDLARTRAYEARYTRHFEQVIVSSPEDAWALRTLRRHLRPHPQPEPQRWCDSATNHNVHDAITVVPNGVDLDYFAPQPIARESATIVFSGKMSYHANEAAALHLVRDIMPLVWERRPEIRVVIAGSAPPPSVRALATDRRVTVTGYLDDLRPAIAGATLAVAPLRYGVGIQNKVLEAMAMATPVVAARHAARALHAVEGRDLLLAEHPREYADAIFRLMEDPQRAAAIGASGRRYVEQHHTWDAAAGRLETVYSTAIEQFNDVTRLSQTADERVAHPIGR